MVAPKNITSTNKNGEKPSTTSKFVEPEGMMTIDLNSNEYEEHKQIVRKNKKWEELKYLSKLLCLLGSICMLIAIFMILAFLDKEYHFASQTPIKLNQTATTLTEEEFFSQYINNITQEMLKKHFYIKDYPRKIILCRLTKTFENCCDLFRESNNQELTELCALDDILKSFVNNEISSKRKKRQTDDHYYEDRNIAPPLNYEDDYYDATLEENAFINHPHSEDNYFGMPMEEVAFNDKPQHYQDGYSGLPEADTQFIYRPHYSDENGYEIPNAHALLHGDNLDGQIIHEQGPLEPPQNPLPQHKKDPAPLETQNKNYIDSNQYIAPNGDPNTNKHKLEPGTNHQPNLPNSQVPVAIDHVIQGQILTENPNSPPSSPHNPVPQQKIDSAPFGIQNKNYIDSIQNMAANGQPEANKQELEHIPANDQPNFPNNHSPVAIDHFIQGQILNENPNSPPNSPHNPIPQQKIDYVPFGIQDKNYIDSYQNMAVNSQPEANKQELEHISTNDQPNFPNNHSPVAIDHFIQGQILNENPNSPPNPPHNPVPQQKIDSVPFGIQNKNYIDSYQNMAVNGQPEANKQELEHVPTNDQPNFPINHLPVDHVVPYLGHIRNDSSSSSLLLNNSPQIQNTYPSPPAPSVITDNSNPEKNLIQPLQFQPATATATNALQKTPAPSVPTENSYTQNNLVQPPQRQPVPNPGAAQYASADVSLSPLPFTNPPQVSNIFPSPPAPSLFMENSKPQNNLVQSQQRSIGSDSAEPSETLSAKTPNIKSFILLPREVKDLIINHVTLKPFSIENRFSDQSKLDYFNPEKKIVFEDENHNYPSSIEATDENDKFSPRILPNPDNINDVFHLESSNKEHSSLGLSEEKSASDHTESQYDENLKSENIPISEAISNRDKPNSISDRQAVSENERMQTQNHTNGTSEKNENVSQQQVHLGNKFDLFSSESTEDEPVSSKTEKCLSKENEEQSNNKIEEHYVTAFPVNREDMTVFVNISQKRNSSNDLYNVSEQPLLADGTKKHLNKKGLLKLTENVNLRENTQQNENFRPKAKLESFATASEDIQSNQQTIVSPCFYPYMSPYMSPVRLGIHPENSYLKVVSVSQPRVQQQPLYVINPPMYYNIPQQNYAAPPQNYIQNYAAIPQHVLPQTAPTAPQYGGYNSPIQVSAPGGQFYMCNPIPTPTNNIAGVSGVEIRRDATNLQTLMEEFERKNISFRNPLTRESGLVCPLGEQACLDNTKCVKNYQVCDGEVHCDDASDEIVCQCKQRIAKFRLCDGYCDCPTCDDETGCFGCTEDEFSCNDWSRYRRSSCVPKSQRCDNIQQCEITGKDEEGCSALTDRIGNISVNIVSNSVGFLHRNYKGKWYPTCLGAERWANEVCQTESGPSMISPKSHMTLTTDSYHGEFINILPNDEVSLVPACIENRAAYVECPPLYCGLRYLTKNAYRGDEVDISIEDTLNDLERYTLGTELKEDALDSNNSNHNIHEYDFYDTEQPEPATLGETRIVGGKPSQPGAWPWLVSIYMNGNFHCGGVLINELWVITAAHCVDRYWLFYYEIQAGSLRRFSFSPMDQTRIAQLAIPHEFYSKSKLRNDVALIKVSAPFRFNKYVRPICLPSESTAGADFLKGPPPGTKCTTVGWGATVEHGADPDHLREVEVPIITHCKHKDDTDVAEICAGLHEGGKDACQGDSGGPLMCRNPNNPNQWYLSGIVSHGEGCGRPDEPGVYTRVSMYMGWIAEHTGDGQITLRTPLQKCPGFVCKGTKRCVPKKRHCDKIVDCLLGDDELNCDNSFHNLFKHSRSNFFIDRKKEEFENAFIDSMAEVIDPELSVIGAKNAAVIIQKPTVAESGTTSDLDKKKLYFKCTQLLQIIPGYKKCNKVFDCEDGTDEINCSCKDYVENLDKDAICDGITDCVDLSDENQCMNCTQTEFACRLSQECISLSKRCDGVRDCKSHEDEMNCAILSNGKFLTFENKNPPTLVSKGVVTVNRNGTWKPLCLNNNTSENTRASTATGICNKLGFEEYTAYHKYIVADKNFIFMNNVDLGFLVKVNRTIREPCSDCCEGLYVSCSENAFSPPNFKHTKLADSVELYSLPWTAAIYADGNYKCMGTLIDREWIVTSRECFDSMDRLETLGTVALGKGKMHLSVKGPYEQVVRIVLSEHIVSTNIVLLKTAHNLTLNKYVQSARLDVRRENLQKEKCFAVGLDDTRKVVFVQVIPIKNCLVGYRCFEAKPQENCKYDQPWSGTIVCNSRNGWYPAAVFSYIKGPCGFSPSMQFTSVKYYKNQISNAINHSNNSKIIPPVCDGFLCELGNCIPKSKICDGISDCHGSEDESPDLCYEKEHKCHVEDECRCSQTHLKCPSSNKCFPKSSYCDRINNCGEFEDEPEICSCRNYLNLTYPDKICDGVLHCMDRSDEDPSVCTCKSGDFQCGNNSTDHCVSQELVCDGIEDCANGEDEKTCLSLKVENHEKTNAGEVLSRTAGVWHSGCFSLNYTTTQLEDICTELGFTGGSATQLSPPKTLESMEALKPVVDHFDGIWLRRTAGNRMKLRLRTGNEPHVKFSPDNTCYRLFIACI